MAKRCVHLVPQFDFNPRRKRFSLAFLIEQMNPQIFDWEAFDCNESTYPVFEIGGVSVMSENFNIWEIVSGQDYGALLLLDHLYSHCGGDDLSEIESHEDGFLHDHVKLSLGNITIHKNSDDNGDRFRVGVEDLATLVDNKLLVLVDFSGELENITDEEFNELECYLTPVGRYFYCLIERCALVL